MANEHDVKEASATGENGEAGNPAGTPPRDEDPPPAEEATADVQTEIDRLTAEAANLRDQLLRARADYLNLQRRSDNVRTEERMQAGKNLLKELLPVLDNFRHALSVPTADEDYAKGVEMIFQSFYDTLRGLGLEPVEAHGQPFDPHIHHAIENVPTEEVPEGTVVGELQPGYTYRGQLIRPALVRVAVKP
jgi:molecular chaperone GrpE